MEWEILPDNGTFQIVCEDETIACLLSYDDALKIIKLQAENKRLRDALNNKSILKCAELILTLDIVDAIVNKKAVVYEIIKKHFAKALTKGKPEIQTDNEPDITKCPRCGGTADNGFDRCMPPSPYVCTKCEGKE